jgi:glycosyltransferase involved in cell wall biosynthesis
MRSAFIVWARYQRRAESLAEQLGASLHFVWDGRGREVVAPVRYGLQARQTWRVLWRERPALVFVQNPPIFAVLVCLIYAAGTNSRYVIDTHSGAFLARKWRWALPLHRMASRHALVTIVHNKSQAGIVKAWDCKYAILHDFPGLYSSGEKCALAGKFNVAVVCSFSEDEPLEVIFEAAENLGEVKFHVTGDRGRSARIRLSEKAENVRLTGYLSYPQYMGLLGAADVVLALTTQDDTLLSGANEAVSVGTPLIVSDWPLLRDRFCLGAVYVPNTVEGICEGVRRAQSDHAELRRGILRLRENLEGEWQGEFGKLLAMLNP